MPTYSMARWAGAAAVLSTLTACGGVVTQDAFAFELGVGARWEYEVLLGSEPVGRIVRTIDRCADVTWTDCVSGEIRSARALVQRANDPFSEKVEERYLVRGEGGLVRVAEERLDRYRRDTYSPPFDRVYFGDYHGDRVERHTHVVCRERNARIDAVERTYQFAMIPTTSIVVPAGRFNAVGVDRTGPTGTITKRYWYSGDVGKIAEEWGVYREQLVDFTRGAGTCE